MTIKAAREQTTDSSWKTDGKRMEEDFGEPNGCVTSSTEEVEEVLVTLSEETEEPAAEPV